MLGTALAKVVRDHLVRGLSARLVFPDDGDDLVASECRFANRETEQSISLLSRFLQFFLHGRSLRRCQQLVRCLPFANGRVTLKNDHYFPTTEGCFVYSLTPVLISLIRRILEFLLHRGSSSRSQKF